MSQEHSPATGGGRLAVRVLQGDGLTFAERTAAHALIVRALATDAAPLTTEFSEFIGRLSDLAHSADFWADKPYGNRLYYGSGPGEYIAGDILQAFLHALKINAAPQAPAVTGKAPSGLAATEQTAGAAPTSVPSERGEKPAADWYREHTEDEVRREYQSATDYDAPDHIRGESFEKWAEAEGYIRGDALETAPSATPCSADDAEDAARYRWIRENAWASGNDPRGDYYLEIDVPCDASPNLADIDAAVDRARFK